MKVLLIKPRSFFSAKGAGPPLGLLYIASALKKDGHQVVLRDFMVFRENPEKELKKIIENRKIRIAGVTCNSHERFEAFKIIRILKQLDKNIITVIVG